MSVRAIENWALIQGKIIDLGPHRELDQYATATVDVTQVTPVSGYPNLFAWAIGKQIPVNIPVDKASALSLTPGNEISARVRKSDPTNAFIDPDSLIKFG
jgi:hypothetical protein